MSWLSVWKNHRTVILVVSVFVLMALIAGCGCMLGMPRKGRPQIGMASWYGKKYHGRLTANGEIFDMYRLSAAHRKLPLGTRVKVTNLKNRKSVVLKVNDRGPYIRGRILDLSYAAAKALGSVEDGVVKVKIEIVD